MHSIDRKFSVAPMLDCTDRHARYLMRLITGRAVLFSEMVTTGAILHGDRERHLGFNVEEQPLVLQLGGSDPEQLAQCAKVGENYGYDEINLNVGCPSDRVQSGQFGACLMATPDRVADCLTAMQEATELPITVKCRLGVDELDSYDYFVRFIERQRDAGCEVFYVHARKAWLKGLSPKENRQIPPLRYDWVYRLKQHLGDDAQVILNGGLNSIDACLAALEQVDGVMLGRAPYSDVALLAEVDQKIYGDQTAATDEQQVLEQYLQYIEDRIEEGIPLKCMARHLMGFYHGRPGARAWRRCLGEEIFKSGAGVNAIRAAAAHIIR